MNRQHPCSTRLQCVCFLVPVSIVIGALLALLILYLPNYPNFEVDSFFVDSRIVVTPNHDSTVCVSAVWNITFFVRNANGRSSISYDNVDVFLYYKTLELSHQRLRVFIQNPKNETFAYVNLTRPASTDELGVVNAMVKDMQDFELKLDVKLRGKVQVYTWVLTVWSVSHEFSINCDDVTVNFSPIDGTGWLAGRSQGCYSAGGDFLLK